MLFPIDQPRNDLPIQSRHYSRAVHHDGRAFIATTTMAEIFAKHAQDVITRGDWELVPLLHRDGIDLLLIGPQSVFHVVAIEIGFALNAPAPARGRRVHSDRAAS